MHTLKDDDSKDTYVFSPVYHSSLCFDLLVTFRALLSRTMS